MLIIIGYTFVQTKPPVLIVSSSSEDEQVCCDIYNVGTVLSLKEQLLNRQELSTLKNPGS